MLPLFPPSRLPHLELQRTEPTGRRWKPRPPRLPVQDNESHGLALRSNVERTLTEFQARPRPKGVDPTLILRVITTHYVEDDAWRRAGLTVVGAESDKVLLLFANDTEMTAFRERVEAYEKGVRSSGRADQVRPDHSKLMEAIEPEGMGPLGPMDRTGRRLADLLSAGGPESDVVYYFDVELWHLGTREACDTKLNELGRFLHERGGRIADRLVRDGLVQARVRVAGAYVEELLTIESIASVDLPPRPSHAPAEVMLRRLNDVPPIRPPDPDSPRLCVIDSGIARGHPLLRDAVGETMAAPGTLGDGLDVHGHGTMVASAALYGNVNEIWHAEEIAQEIWIDAARVTNANNTFDDERLISTQMIEAISYFAGLGCRIFNISLGDKETPFRAGMRPSAWSATLDNLANELGVLIVVSAGNYYHFETEGVTPEECASGYPRYLVAAGARIIEPATAANVLTVGALSGHGQPERNQRYPDDVPPRPIAAPGQPAPFTRAGFGVLGAIKPELVEFGGNLSYDPQQEQVLLDKGLGVVLLNWEHDKGRLFALGHGTSFAAPRVAHLAAKVFSAYPDASANLVRALLVHGAQLPQALTCLPLTMEEGHRLCGYGQPNIERVLYSSEHRAVLLAENELALDSLHIYEIPIPIEFREAVGERQIGVTLAFDPPVRRQRAEYLGSSMSFRLVRGLPLDEVARIFRAPAAGENKPSLPSCNDCHLEPTSTRRDKGTVQHGAWTVHQNRSLEYPEPFYLVVRNERGWQKPEEPPQAYAVVVSLEHRSRPIQLYNAVRGRTRERQRARVRR